MPLAELSPLLVSALITVAAGALGLYVNKKVEHLATKEQFKDVLAQTAATTQAVEEIRSDIAQRERQRELELTYQALQRPVVEEATRLLVRIAELEKGDFLHHYKEPWSPESLSKTDLQRNKRDTTVFRFLRFLGAFYLYRARTAGLPRHASDRRFSFYFDDKIVPALATAGFPGATVVWRETIFELSELAVRYSDQWREMRPLTWFEFVALVNDPDDAGQFLKDNTVPIANFLAARGDRLWIVGIFLADLIQDAQGTDAWEKVRSALLGRLVSSRSAGFHLYGRGTDGRNDIELADLDRGIVPRNPLSPWYDREANPVGYDIRTGAEVPEAVVEVR